MNLSNPMENEIIRKFTHVPCPLVLDERGFQTAVHSKPLFHRVNEVVQMFREVEEATVDFRGGYDCVIQKLRVHGTVGDRRKFISDLTTARPFAEPFHEAPAPFFDAIQALMPFSLP
ncbi:hypothetical protein B1A87_011910 [Arthrobacter sp. KBS0703]|jgi:hypothetical protein|uniref:hypothetical protein n=1 Tax=Arthrobacter sp. KBS0703 TaxID=1955698 RepID=UPI00118F07A2|nr:hypothetical protein [Arthrobacter sp. KBS0703]TSE16454.1 hypothetical protein B1A87_011910 [Arthrobacter sp. KBS0703]